MRHILSLSGGKDSAALAIHMRDRVPQMEYIFSDTNKKLPEAYEKPYEKSGNTFTWSERESLSELERPERMEAIREEHAKRTRARAQSGADLTLAQVYERMAREDEDEGDACLICTL